MKIFTNGGVVICQDWEELKLVMELLQESGTIVYGFGGRLQ
jgi:hypothetical protein